MSRFTNTKEAESYLLSLTTAEKASCAEVTGLYRQSFPKPDPRWVARAKQRFSADSSLCEKVVQLFDRNNILIGFAAVVLGRVQRGGNQFKTAQLVDLMVHTEHRTVLAINKIYHALAELIDREECDFVYTLPNKKSLLLNSRYLKLELKNELFPRLIPFKFCFAGRRISGNRSTLAGSECTLRIPTKNCLIVTNAGGTRFFVRKYWNGVPVVVKAAQFEGNELKLVSPKDYGQIQGNHALLFGVGLEYVQAENGAEPKLEFPKSHRLKIQGKALTPHGEKFDFKTLQLLDFDFFWY